MRKPNPVRQHVNNLVPGETFATRDILTMDLRSNIDSTLHRLVRVGILIRLTYGVFMKAGEGAEVPPVHEIVRIKARAFGRQVAAHAETHAGHLEIAPPCDQDKYITDGSRSSFTCNHRRVTLHRSSIRKLTLGDSKVGALLRAIWHLGRRNVDSNVIQTALQARPVDLASAVRRLRRLLPQWLVGRIEEFLTAMAATP